MTFIKLTPNATYAWAACHVRADSIDVVFEPSSGQGGGAELKFHGSDWQMPVKESPAEILALLAEPQPVAVTVTNEMVDAALDAEHGEAVAKGYRHSWRDLSFVDTERKRMRAALEAALAVRAP